MSVHWLCCHVQQPLSPISEEFLFVVVHISVCAGHLTNRDHLNVQAMVEWSRQRGFDHGQKGRVHPLRAVMASTPFQI